MISNNREAEPDGSGSRFTVQPERELGANWEVDLAKKLEDYLIKICSGQVNDSEHPDYVPVNFAEAALVVQGSVQVYSRKVEYLYNLVLHTLDFLSEKRQHDQSEGTSVQPEESGSREVSEEENDQFWGLDDVPVEVKNSLGSSSGKDSFSDHFVKPPANLVVVEGDCLDTTGDRTELESYLLATNDLYRDFILLDPCDAVAVNDFLKGDEAGKEQSGAYTDSASRKSYQSPTRGSGGTAHNSSLGRNKDANLNPSPGVGCSFEVRNSNMGPDPAAYDNFEDKNHKFNMDDRSSEPRDFDDSDDDDDPWKPLNPHDPGNLKLKPFRKVKAFRRNGVNSTKRVSITTLFPPAKLHGTISPELTEIWETQHSASERQTTSQYPPLYEKLRKSLVNEGQETFDAFGNPVDYKEDNGYDSGDADFGRPDVDMPENMYMDEDAPLHHDKHDDATGQFETNEAFEHGGPDSQASLEDLCRAHLDALLASIAETEKQTELAARVSSWKQKIEHNLEEQDLRPPFDIHEYGESILDKLSLEEDNEIVMPFTDIVKGQEKHDVARTFSALLQLVNNGDVDLDRSGVDDEIVCYTAVNPFRVQLLNHLKRQENPRFVLPKKRVKSPKRKVSPKGDRNKSSIDESLTMSPSSSEKENFSGTISGVRCSPESKRSRRTRIIESVDLHSSG